MNGLRIGSPEVARLGTTEADTPTIASFIARGLAPHGEPASIAPEVSAWRGGYTAVHFTADNPS